MLYNALDCGYVSQDHFGTLLDQSREVSRLVAALQSAVQRQRDAQREAARGSAAAVPLSPESLSL
jgi:hypothetical protein